MKKQLKKLITIALLMLLVVAGCRKSEYIIEERDRVINDNGMGTGTVTWTSDKEYLIEGKVFVNDGQVLTIEPGTVIRARRGTGSAASALIVARGGKIIAEGSAVDPIIFTCEGDDLEGSIALDERGLWGGLIILGNATINTPNGEAHVEGISTSEPRAIFGGSNDEDNSGILRYVSIRHGGTDLGQDNEINGLTLGGVGSGTTIENIEVIANADDGIEIFGGTVHLKRIVVSNCSDDAIDIDLGYRGKGQFWCLLQSTEHGDKLLEIDGAEELKTNQPYTEPILYNITAIGRGAGIYNSLISFNDNAAGIIVNSIFTDQRSGIEIEYSQVRNNSFTQWQDERLKIEYCLFHNVNNNEEASMLTIVPINDEEVSEEEQLIDQYFFDAHNLIANPGFERNDGGISPIPDLQAVSSSYAPLPNDDFFEEAAYRGAFDDYNWVGEWTLSHQEGLIW
jgi:hypothetical protein